MSDWPIRIYKLEYIKLISDILLEKANIYLEACKKTCPLSCST